jgi:hypothetical protein
LSAIELVRFAGQNEGAITTIWDNTDVATKALEIHLKSAAAFYKNFSAQIDRDIFVAMMKAYYHDVPAEYHFDALPAGLKKYKGSFERWADEAYTQSVFRSYETLHEAMTNRTKKITKRIADDPFLAIFRSYRKMLDEKILDPYLRLMQQSDSLSRVYMAAQLLAGRQKIFYPDANQTLRVAFGVMEGYSPADVVDYRSYSTLEGVMEKNNPDIYDYNVPQALKTVYNRKDFGDYDVDGTVPVCFIASNHTSGGNSGSPVLNRKGELIGLNFDRNWEGTMSDLLYDPAQCRNIIVDIRYVLFIIEKVYGEWQIVDELNLDCGCD